MKGPKVEIALSCFDCEFCKGKSYTCQGDSGTDVYCTYQGANKTIGDTTWKTPEWCPFRESAIAAVIAAQTHPTPTPEQSHD